APAHPRAPIATARSGLVRTRAAVTGGLAVTGTVHAMSDPLPTATPSPSLRSLWTSVYLPTLLFAVGQGAVIPIVALTATDLGASAALAGVIVAVRGIGTMAFDVPAGALVGRIGERRAMVVGTVILAVALIGCVISPNPFVFAGAMF